MERNRDKNRSGMRLTRKNALILGLGLALCVSLGANVYLGVQRRQIRMQMASANQRELSDVVSAMADIEVNLQKLLIASDAAQSAQLLGETALLAQHVESGLARLPMRYETVQSAMKFAGQMGQYAMALAAQMSEGGMLTSGDEEQISGMLTACRALNGHLLAVGEQLYTQPLEATGGPDGDEAASWAEEAIAGESAIEYPSLIFDGPFSDGRQQGTPRGLTGERATRETARAAAARFAGVTPDLVRDAADSGGVFEAFGFTADTPQGRVNVQVTGVGAHLLWMMPEQAEYEERTDRETCLTSAKVYLADMGFGMMEPCFVQQYDGMVVANFAAVQDGVLLYPDQVKVQISMASGTVVGAECSQYLTNHVRRTELSPQIGESEARQMLSPRLDAGPGRLCVIPQESGERLCWGFEGTFAGSRYYAFVDAVTGEAAEILQVADTPDGETAI